MSFESASSVFSRLKDKGAIPDNVIFLESVRRGVQKSYQDRSALRATKWRQQQVVDSSQNDTSNLARRASVDYQDRQPRAGDAVLAIVEHEFREDFQPIFEMTFELTNCIPEQASHEIRNALVHLAAALHRGDRHEFEREIARARTHIFLATLDCLMLLIAHEAEVIQRSIWIVEKKTAVSEPVLRERLTFLTSRAKQILKSIRASFEEDELEKAKNDAELLLDDYMRFHEHLFDNYPLSVWIRETPELKPQVIFWLFRLGIVTSLAGLTFGTYWVGPVAGALLPTGLALLWIARRMTLKTFSALTPNSNSQASVET